MLKIILSVLASVFITVSVVVILYWRDAQYEPSISEILIYFALIPLALALVLLTPYLLIKWQQKRKKNEDAQHNAEQAEPQTATAETHWQQLNIFSAASQSVLGENETLVESIIKLTGPELDSQLFDGQGNPILSYRMSELDEMLEEGEDSYLPILPRRITLLIQQQLEQHIEPLYAVAEHLKQSALFYDSQLAYEYRMHPAWINPNVSEELEQESSPVKQVARLNYLNIYLVLSESVLHAWDEAQSTDLIHDYFMALGVLPKQINCIYSYFSISNSYENWLKILSEIEHQAEQISLVIVADSEISQELIDEKTWVTEHYIPAEFASSCLIGSSNVQIQNLEHIKNIHVALNQENILSNLEHLKLVELEQYQLEEPFVSILENPAESRVFKRLQRHFMNTPIETEHYFYSKSSLGNTESLSKIFGFMLALHAKQSMHSMIYSTEHPLTQVFISPANVSELA